MSVKKGDLVYYLDRVPSLGTYLVKFGVVDEVYTSEIYVKLYEPQKTRLINGVDSKELPLVGEWQKLPKNWKRELYNLLDIEDVFQEIRVPLVDKKGLLKLIEDGILVQPSENDQMRVETDISKDGWRIIKKAQYCGEYKPDGKVLQNGDFYETFDDANKQVVFYKNEMDRISRLSDEEWSIEQIVKVLNQYKNANKASEEDVQKMYDKLLALPNIEDLETRFCYGQVQYKYSKQKRWKDI